MVVSGHSHLPKIEMRQGVVYLNPGSAGPRRFRLPITIAIVDLSAEPLQPVIRPVVEWRRRATSETQRDG
jgi:predicted phosphodiesterase